MDTRNDLEAICREQLESFRIKELKDVLTRLGLPKQGKKQVLRDKIMAVFTPGDRQPGVRGRTFGREETARVIADIYSYRKRQGPAAPDLATGKNATAAGSSSAARSDEPENEITNEEAKIRCPCGNANEAGTMIQCDDARKCGVWQHISCVLIPDKGEEGSEPEVLYFLGKCTPPDEDFERSVVLMFSVERSFRLSRSEKELISRPGHDLQVWCVLLSDKVPFRIHWPVEASLRLNGNIVRVVNRPAQQLLGMNGRDEGPSITNLVKEGDNDFSFWTNDSRQFCVGVRIIRRLTVPEVLEHIPDETTGEKFEDALFRVRRSVIGVGSGAPGEDDDDDDLVVSDVITVNLRCPLSSSRIKTAGRFKPCVHMGCFDLETLVEINQRARKWQCPICMKNYSLEQLIIDPFFSRVASAMKDYGDDVTEVEMKADGFWRPKLEGDARSKEPWRTPEGFLAVTNGVNISFNMQMDLKPVKLEEGLPSHDGSSLKLGMKRNREGQWIMNGTRRYNGVTSPNVAGRSQPQKPTVISRSTSATDSNDDRGNGDERSVNQGPTGRDIGPSFKVNGGQRSNPATPSGHWDSGRSHDIPNGADVIVLSDTDDDAEDIIVGSSEASMLNLPGHRAAVRSAVRSPELLSTSVAGDSDILQQTGSGDLALTAIPILPPYGQMHCVGAPLGSPATAASASGYLDKSRSFWAPQLTNVVPFNLYAPTSDTPPSNVNNLTTPLRPTPVQAIEGPGFGLSVQPSSVRTGTEWRGFPRCSGGPSSYPDCSGFPDDSGRVSPTESPLHIFLPSQPARAVQTPFREPVLPEDEAINNSWFSLSLGNDMSVDAHVSTSGAVGPGGTEPLRTSPQRRDQLDSLASTANVLLGMTRHGTQTLLEPLPSTHRSQMITTQRRSSSSTARHRRYYRIDSDSD